MKIKNNIVYFVILFLNSCNNLHEYNTELSDKELCANIVIKKVANKLEQEQDLIAIGTGGGMMHQIRMLALSFEYRQQIYPWKGRELLMTAIHTFLFEINSDEKIRPYLTHYPFLPEDIQIRIFLRNPDRSDIVAGELTTLSIVRGIIKYNIYDPITDRLVTAYKETYPEALDQIARHSTEPHTLSLPKPSVPEDHRTHIGIL